MKHALFINPAGVAKRDPVRAADSMIDAVVDYASTTSAPGVREIKIVIFQPHLLDVFYASMQRKGVTTSKSGGGMRTPKSFFSKVAGKKMSSIWVLNIWLADTLVRSTESLNLLICYRIFYQQKTCCGIKTCLIFGENG